MLYMMPLVADWGVLILSPGSPSVALAATYENKTVYAPTALAAISVKGGRRGPTYTTRHCNSRVPRLQHKVGANQTGNQVTYNYLNTN